MLGFFRPRVLGHIRQYKLEKWWFSEFSDEEREWMAGTYAPMGLDAKPLTEGKFEVSDKPPYGFLGNCATWFNKPGRSHCGMAFSDKADEFYSGDLPVTERHFGLANRCKVFYRWRDDESGTLEKAIEACERSIEFHHEAASAMSKSMGFVPAHACFRQLRIIEEKRGNYDRAIEVCEIAMSGGWDDNWVHQIDRLEKKRKKLGSDLPRILQR